MTTLRICFVGDSLTAGTGDAAYVGWPGRLCGAERSRGHDLTLYNLGVRADTSALIGGRWRAECAARLPDGVPHALVFMFGTNDSGEEAGAGVRVPLERSLEHARAIIAEAKAWKPTLWLSPAPINEAQMPLDSTAGIKRDFRNRRILETVDAYASLATELEVPFLDLFRPLAGDPRWQHALAACDGVHPAGAGYAVIAEQVGRWAAWRAWMAD